MRTPPPADSTAKGTAGASKESTTGPAEAREAVEERSAVLLTKIGLALAALAAMCSLALRIAESISG